MSEVTASASTSTGSDNEQPLPGKKRKTKSESSRDEQLNKLLKIAQQEDHPVELVLGGLA